MVLANDQLTAEDPLTASLIAASKAAEERRRAFHRDRSDLVWSILQSSYKVRGIGQSSPRRVFIYIDMGIRTKCMPWLEKQRFAVIYYAHFGILLAT